MRQAAFKILYLRNKHGLTQQQLADKAGVTNVTISDIEKQKVTPSPETLNKIAGIFGMTMTQLLEYTDEELDKVEIQEKSVEQNLEIKRWALDPSNFEFIELAYDIAINKGIPKSMIPNLKFEVKIPKK